MTKYKMIFRLALACVLALSGLTAEANTEDEYSTYCTVSGGSVESMPVQFVMSSGVVQGQSKLFCNFNTSDRGFVAIGLETFSSPLPSIAATYIKTLSEIKANSPLMKGDRPNPSINVCKNLGGATVNLVTDGGFVNALGQSDICVFGDASMVSAWSLIYMANHREGYDDIKNKVKAEPLR